MPNRRQIIQPLDVQITRTVTTVTLWQAAGRYPQGFRRAWCLSRPRMVWYLDMVVKRTQCSADATSQPPVHQIRSAELSRKVAINFHGFDRIVARSDRAACGKDYQSLPPIQPRGPREPCRCTCRGRLRRPPEVLQTEVTFVIIMSPASPAHSAPLAQLAEQLTLNQRVVGSSPTGGIWLETQAARAFAATVYCRMKDLRFLEESTHGRRSRVPAERVSAWRYNFASGTISFSSSL